METTWGDGLTARPIAKDDAEAWSELLAAAEKVDDEGEHYDADDLRDELDDPSVNAGTDTLGLWAGARMVGFAAVRSNTAADETDRVHGQGTVHPDLRRRGLGTKLLGWVGARALGLHTERHPELPGELHVGTVATNTGLQTMLEHAGFAPTRYFFEMSLRLAGRPTPPVTVPDGLRLTVFEPSYDEATRTAHNEAFLDHWGNSPRSEELWRTWFTGARAFRPAMSHLMLDGDEVAAYVLGYEFAAHAEATGVRDLYVGQVGTRRPYRGKGAAQATIARTLEAAERDGFETASLGVDADNPTGALGLYERLGFEVERRYTTYVSSLG